MDPASVCFHAQIASSTQAPPSLRIYAHLPFVSIMADWMNEMANAVEEAEAANAPCTRRSAYGAGYISKRSCA